MYSVLKEGGVPSQGHSAIPSGNLFIIRQAIIQKRGEDNQAETNKQPARQEYPEAVTGSVN
jgi:hypothetical protein